MCLLTVADLIFVFLLLCIVIGVMRIKEEAVFCNLPKEVFSKSLGMLKQNWVADVDCIVFASIVTTNSLYLNLTPVQFCTLLKCQQLLVSTQGLLYLKLNFCYAFQNPRVHLCNQVFLYLNVASALKNCLNFKDLS